MMMRLIEAVTNRLSQLERHQEILIQSQENLLNNQQTMGQSITGMTQSTQQLLESITHLDQMRAQLTDKVGSTSAAVERLDCVVDYLLKQDSQRNDLPS
jgi:flagellar biosynthesis/type III secretory pathway chaperone